MAHCESPAEQGCSKGTSGDTWSSWPKISSIRESQRHCGLLENRFTHHNLCDEHHERWVEALVQDVLETEDKAPSESIRPYELKRLIKSLRIKRPLGLMAFQTKASGTSQSDLCFI
jgi:hypothetical protein